MSNRENVMDYIREDIVFKVFLLDAVSTSEYVQLNKDMLDYLSSEDYEFNYDGEHSRITLTSKFKAYHVTFTSEGEPVVTDANGETITLTAHANTIIERYRASKGRSAVTVPRMDKIELHIAMNATKSSTSYDDCSTKLTPGDA